MTTFQETLENWDIWKVQDKELLSLILGRPGGKTTSRIIDLILKKPLNKNQIAKKLNLDYKTVQYHVNILEIHEYIVSERFENVIYIYPTKKLFITINGYKVIKNSVKLSEERKE